MCVVAKCIRNTFCFVVFTLQLAAACGESGPSNKEISDAYCSVAEIYLTDLW